MRVRVHLLSYVHIHFSFTVDLVALYWAVVTSMYTHFLLVCVCAESLSEFVCQQCDVESIRNT